MNKVKQTLKELFATREGWFSWIIANVITSALWFIPLAIGWLTQNNNLMLTAGAIWGFMIAPFTPVWVVNTFIAVFFVKVVFRKREEIKL